MAHRIPLNHIFTIPFDAQVHQHNATQHPPCPGSTCPRCGGSQHGNSHYPHDVSHLRLTFQGQPGAHGNSPCCHGGHHPHHQGTTRTSPTNRSRPSGRPLLLAMSIDSKTLAVADSLNTISIFTVGTSDEKLTLDCIRPASSTITALAITEGGSTVLFVEKCAPAILKMFNTSDPTALHEISPVHERDEARVVSCSISSHFILASFYNKRTSTRAMALWRRAHNKIDSELTQVFAWNSEQVGSSQTHLYSPLYVTEWHTQGDHCAYNAEVAYHVDKKLVYHPEVGNEECVRPSCILLDRKPIAIRIDQSHGRDCVYILSENQLRIYRVNRRSQLCLVDCVDFGNEICSSAVCGIWKGRRNRHVTVARIVNGQVMVFRAQLPNGVRFQIP